MASAPRISPLLALAGVTLAAGCRPGAPVLTPDTRPVATDAATQGKDDPVADDDTEARPDPPPADAEQTDSGLHYVLQRGTREDPAPREHDSVTVRYCVRHRDGRLVRQTPADRPPETLDPQWLPPGWAEGMRLMRPGDKATLWLPAKLAYGDDGPGPTGPLVIDVELVDVVRRDPKDLDLPFAAPPADAISTPEGLKFVRIERGTDDRSPSPDDTIRAHYQGFTTDGQMFDSSHERGQPLQFRPSMVIDGWALMLTRMVEGDKVRVWIPESLAYRGRPGKPAGMLVFDIELIEFVP